MDDLLTTREVAKLLQVKGGTLENWRYNRVRGHKGPAYIKVGGVVRYRRADVERWMEQHQENGEGDRPGTPP
jgi:excisionase family DNA binding protein